jgi:CheY-like chemotaxis protein
VEAFMRVAVVDERQDVLAGRVGWLRKAGHAVVAYSFESALLEMDWSGFDTVVLDGRDDRERPMLVGGGGLPDRYLGPRVAEHTRAICGREHPTITLISAYARTHPELSLRCQEVGVDYAFDYLDVPSPELFVRAVESPQSMGPRPPVRWQMAGFAAQPRISEALTEAQLSRATRPLLGRTEGGQVSAYERRRLRERLDQLLPIVRFPTGGRRRLAHNNEIRPILRRLLGLKPDDDDNDQEIVNL